MGVCVKKGGKGDAGDGKGGGGQQTGWPMFDTGPSGWRGTAGLCVPRTAALVGGFSRDGAAVGAATGATGSVRFLPRNANMAACVCVCKNVAGQMMLCLS